MSQLTIDQWLSLLAILIAVLLGIAGLIWGGVRRRKNQKQKVGSGRGIQAGRDINVGR